MARRIARPENKQSAGVGFDGVAWSVNPWGKTLYIGNLPGDGGVDWGWTEKRSEAKPLTPYWQRRFKADRRRCGIPVQP